MRRKSPGLSAADFQAWLDQNGFKFDKRLQRFLDLRQDRGDRISLIPAVRHRGNQVDRPATISALLAARGKRLADRAAADTLKAEQERLASTIAPRVLPPARGALAGAEAIAALADDFISINARDEGVAFPDLMRLGWRKQQIFEHADAARELAYSRQGGNAA